MRIIFSSNTNNQYIKYILYILISLFIFSYFSYQFCSNIFAQDIQNSSNSSNSKSENINVNIASNGSYNSTLKRNNYVKFLWNPYLTNTLYTTNIDAVPSGSIEINFSPVSTTISFGNYFSENISFGVDFDILINRSDEIFTNLDISSKILQLGTMLMLNYDLYTNKKLTPSFSGGLGLSSLYISPISSTSNINQQLSSINVANLSFKLSCGVKYLISKNLALIPDLILNFDYPIESQINYSSIEDENSIITHNTASDFINYGIRLGARIGLEAKY